jgi:hypothetical protein
MPEANRVKCRSARTRPAPGRGGIRIPAEDGSPRKRAILPMGAPPISAKPDYSGTGMTLAGRVSEPGARERPAVTGPGRHGRARGPCKDQRSLPALSLSSQSMMAPGSSAPVSRCPVTVSAWVAAVAATSLDRVAGGVADLGGSAACAGGRAAGGGGDATRGRAASSVPAGRSAFCAALAVAEGALAALTAGFSSTGPSAITGPGSSGGAGGANAWSTGEGRCSIGETGATAAGAAGGVSGLVRTADVMRA